MTISEYTTRKAEMDQRFMRFLKELRLQRIFFKSTTKYPLKSDAGRGSYYNCRANFILNGFAFRDADAEELLHKCYPTLTWGYFDGLWRARGSRIRKTKNIPKITKPTQKYMT